MNKESKVLTWTRNIILGLILIITLFPVYWMVSSSFKPAGDLFTIPPKIIQNVFSLEWYKVILTQGKIPKYFLNSFIVSFSTMCINMVVATLGAYSLTRFNFKGRKVILLAILFSYVFPPILLLLPLYENLTALGLLDSYVGVIITHTTFTIPFSLWILRSYFKEVPIELEEAGMVDGLTRFGVFIRIVLPLTAPGILSVGLFSFILSWNEYLYASVLLTGADYKTLPIGISEFIAQYDIQWGEIMASSTITAIPVLILFISIQKYFVKGLTAGSIKG